jgi:cardiolipin synthase (CMP-forming)
MQMVALGFLICGPAGDHYFPYVSYIGLLLLWISALLTIYTGYDYFRAGLNHLISEDT